MFYFYAKDVEDSFERLYQSDDEVSVNDYVVVEGYNEIPVTAKITQLLNKFQALSINRKPEPIIDVINFKIWKDNRNRELEKLIILSKMEDMSKEITLIEKMEKMAGRDSEMAELLKAYKGVEEVTIDDLKE